MKTFTEKRFFEWHEDDVSVTLREKSGSYGGGSEVFVVLPFDTTQVTSDKNWSHPKFNDPCHPLAAGQHPPTIVIKERESDNEENQH